MCKFTRFLYNKHANPKIVTNLGIMKMRYEGQIGNNNKRNSELICTIYIYPVMLWCIAVDVIYHSKVLRLKNEKHERKVKKLLGIVHLPTDKNW